MAHKVLSKDMTDLVHAIKLVQKYFNTTVEAEYKKWVYNTRKDLIIVPSYLSPINIYIYIYIYIYIFFIPYYSRGMLSSAHVLAMDAKNLLDVVDQIRIRYPQVNLHIVRGRGGITPMSDKFSGPNSTASASSSANSSAASSLEKNNPPSVSSSSKSS